MSPDEARARELYAEVCEAIPEFEGFMRDLYAVGRVPRDFVGPIHPDTLAKMSPPMIQGLRNIHSLTYFDEQGKPTKRKQA